MKSPLDPFLGGHKTWFLGRKIDAGPVAYSKFAGVIGKPVDSQTHANIVKKDVTRFQNCFVQAQYAMRFRSGFRVENIAVVLAAEERAVTGAEGCKAFFGQIVLEHGRGCDN